MEKQSNKVIVPSSEIILSMQRIDIETYSFVRVGLSSFIYLKMDFQFFFPFFLSDFIIFQNQLQAFFPVIMSNLMTYRRK